MEDLHRHATRICASPSGLPLVWLDLFFSTPAPFPCTHCCLLTIAHRLLRSRLAARAMNDYIVATGIFLFKLGFGYSVLVLLLLTC